MVLAGVQKGVLVSAVSKFSQDCQATCLKQGHLLILGDNTLWLNSKQ